MVDEESPRMSSTGTVKWFSAHRGFGFITPSDGGADIFVHQTAIRAEGFRTLSEGQQVKFEFNLQEGRASAVDVEVLSPSRRGGKRGGGGGNLVVGGRARVRGRGRGERGGWGGVGRGSGECYNCGRIGHFARDCYRGVGGGRMSYGDGGACYSCGEEGHFARDCTRTEQKGERIRAS